MDSEKGRFQYSALKWLYEMELVSDPQLINNLKLNIFNVSGFIKEVELLASQERLQMLIYVELSWIGRKFFQKPIIAGVTDIVNALLPRFRIRVVTDRGILDLAVAKVKQALTGGSLSEATTNPSSGGPKSSISGGVRTASDLLQHPEVKAGDESNGGEGTV
jgi:hypothetical protein